MGGKGEETKGNGRRFGNITGIENKEGKARCGFYIQETTGARWHGEVVIEGTSNLSQEEVEEKCCQEAQKKNEIEDMKWARRYQYGNSFFFFLPFSILF